MSLEDLEEQSFHNLVSFYCAELRRIIGGESISDVLDDVERKKLRDQGVLSYHNMMWYVSEKAKMVLEEE